MGFASNMSTIDTKATYQNISPRSASKVEGEIPAHINDGFETVYNTDPASANYFFITDVYDPFVENSNATFARLFRKYCQSITLSDSIGIQFNTDIFKQRGQSYYQISGIGRNQSVKIEYLDDAPRTMLHIHKNWVDAWYNGAYNAFAVGAKHKFRNMDIHFFRMTDAGPKVYAEATLINMVPSEAGKLFEANYAQPGNENKYSVTYTIDRIDFKFIAADTSSLTTEQLLPFKYLQVDNIKWEATGDYTKDKDPTNTVMSKMKRY